MFHAFHGYSRKNIQQERDNCLQFAASKANPFKGAVYTAAATPFGRIGTVRKPYEPLCLNIFRNMSCNSSQGSFLKSFLFFSAAFCQTLVHSGCISDSSGVSCRWKERWLTLGPKGPTGWSRGFQAVDLASPMDFRDFWVEEVGKVDGDFSNKTWVSWWVCQKWITRLWFWGG